METNNVVKPDKKVKRGIIYLSTIPKYMNVTMIREIFSAYGKVDRVYLQLDENEAQSVKKKRRKAIKHFTEGWVEFESKKVAKFVAATLNNTQISTRKKSKFFDVMWNIKYLPRFKWIHLSERLAYERAVHKQRLLTEIAQAKREVNFFSYNVDRSKKLLKKQKQGEETTFKLPEVKQRDTDSEIRNRKAERWMRKIGQNFLNRYLDKIIDSVCVYIGIVQLYNMFIMIESTEEHELLNRFIIKLIFL